MNLDKKKTNISEDNKNIVNNSRKINFKKFFNFFIFIFAILAILIGSFFAVFEAASSNKNIYDITYKGGYGLNVAVQTQKFDDKGQIQWENPDKNTAISILKNKLDPLQNKNLKFRSWNEATEAGLDKIAIVDVQTAKGTYDNSINNFINDASRPGYLYFTDNTGKDLLVASDKRTPITKVVDSAKATVDKKQQNKPILQLHIKDSDTWNNTIIKNASSGLYIWSDLAYYINDLRNIKDFNQFESLYFLLHGSVDTGDNYDNFHKIFDYYDSNDHSQKQNLWDYFANNWQTHKDWVKTELNNSNKEWAVTTSGTNGLEQGMNPNDPNNTNNIYIKPFINNSKNINYFSNILNNSAINIDKEFNKYQLAYEEKPKNLDKGVSTYDIDMKSNTDAKNAANLINGGLHGLVFAVTNSYFVDPLVSSVEFKVSVIIFSIFIVLLISFLIFYYRLFGFICSLALILMLSISFLLIGVLAIEIGPAVVLAILMILFLNIDSSINFFEHYRKEYHIQNVSNTQSYKLSNKKTFLTVLDYHLILLVLGLTIFIFSTNVLKMFAITLIILCLVSFFTYLFITKSLNYFVIKNRWLDNNKILQMPKHINILKPFKKTKTSSLNITSQNSPVIENNNKSKKITIKKSKLQIIMLSLMSILVITSIALFGAFGIRFGEDTINNNHPGTTIVIYDQGSDLEADKDKLSGLIYDRYHNKFDYTVYVLTKNSSEIGDKSDIRHNLMITSSMKYDTSAESLQTDFIRWLKSNEFDKYHFAFDQTSIQAFKATSNTYSETVKQLLIIFALIVVIILIYILIRFNWTQFLAIIGSLVFTIFVTILLVNIAHIWITLDIFLALAGVIIYVIVDGTILSSKIKYEKIKYDKKNYHTIFDKYKIYKKNKKEYKSYAKKTFDEQLKLVVLSDLKYSNKEFKNKKYEIKNNIKLVLKEKQKTLKSLKKDYKREFQNQQDNYLFTIKKDVVKNSIKRALITSFIFSMITIFMMIFGGMTLAFGLVILFGVNISIFSSLSILLAIWIANDKYNIITSLRISNFLKNKKLDLDEEDVEGVNI